MATNKFNKIVCVDDCGLTGNYKSKIYDLSETVIEYNNVPENNVEIMSRIGDADCVLVSWKTRIDAHVLSKCPGIKYIGMCCSLYDEKSANVDIIKANELGIVVKGVKDYGDQGTLEFIFAQLIKLYSEIIPKQWNVEPTEIGSKTLGILGMGILGQMVARMGLNFGMKVVYYNRSRKEEIEHLGINYFPLKEMLPQCDIVSIHLPRNANVLDAAAFKLLKEPSVLVQTSLGVPFDTDAFMEWVKNKHNYVVFDGAQNVGLFGEYAKDNPNILITSRSSGFTKEAKKRLTEKVWLNMLNFLEN